MPPAPNIAPFVRCARDLVDIAQVGAVLVTRLAIHRAYRQVEAALAPDGMPVVPIGRPMT